MNRQGKTIPYKRPLLAAGLTAVAVTALVLGAVWWLALVCVALLTMWLWCRRGFLCAAVAVLFFLSATGFRHWYVSPAVQADGKTDTLTAVVVACPTYGDMYTVRVTDSALLRRDTRVMLWWDGEESPRLGSTVTAEVEWLAFEDNRTYYAAQGAFVCAFPRNYDAMSIRTATGGMASLADLRLRVVRTLMAAPRRYLADAESSVLAAMCFGERRFLDDRLATTFQGSGLSHLLVVSGLHLSLIVLAVQRLLRRIGMRVGCVVTLLAAWLFAWLAGFSPSIIRAAVMVTVWLIGCLCFCRSDGLNSLGLAALLLLALHPYTLWNVSFQLSFAATLGVLLLAPRLASRYAVRDISVWTTLRNKTLSGAAVCVSALLFTLPIAAYHYGGFPLTSIVSNVLALPVAGAILLLGWVGALCGLVPFLGWLSQAVLWVVHYLVRYLEWVAKTCSPAWAWITVSSLWAWLLLFGVCALVAYAIYHRVPLRRAAAVVAALILLVVGVAYPLAVAPCRLTVVPSDNEGGLILQQGGHCALLITHGEELREITYETAPFIPDVIVVAGMTAACETQLGQFPAAQVLCVDEMPAGTKVTLWRGCDLTVGETGWWRLRMQAESLWIATDPTAAAPADAGQCLYVGGTPTHPPETAYTVVCSEGWLRRHRPVLTGRETFVIENPITLIPHKGEWRMSLWL